MFESSPNLPNPLVGVPGGATDGEAASRYGRRLGREPRHGNKGMRLVGQMRTPKTPEPMVIPAANGIYGIAIAMNRRACLENLSN